MFSHKTHISIRTWNFSITNNVKNIIIFYFVNFNLNKTVVVQNKYFVKTKENEVSIVVSIKLVGAIKFELIGLISTNDNLAIIKYELKKKKKIILLRRIQSSSRKKKYSFFQYPSLWTPLCTAEYKFVIYFESKTHCTHNLKV